MKYIGNKSSDAEITMDFTKGVIEMDYSLNIFGSNLNSNNTCTLHREYSTKKLIIDRIARMFYIYPALFSCLATSEIVMKIIPQQKAQEIALWGEKLLFELYEQQCIGKQSTNIVSFQIRTNLWFEYKLDGDYKSNIQKIELRRRFVKKIRWYGSCFQQLGWNVIFTFSEPPQNGYVVIKSVI